MIQDSKQSLPSTAPHNHSGRITLLSLLFFLSLLVLPLIALRRLSIDLRWTVGYLLALSALTYAAYGLDKRRAKASAWRLSEALLHALEALGGWPGAFLAQRRLRHKCSKLSYQVVFWLIVLLYQFVAFDFLQHWQLSRAACSRLPFLSNHRN